METKPIDYEQFWNSFWIDSSKYGPAPRHRRRIIAKLIQHLPHASVVDIGCGNGELLASLRRRGVDAQLFGSDLSNEALRIAKSRVPDAEFFQLDIGKVAPLQRFDVVVLSEVLEHVENDLEALRRLASVTQHIVISVPGGSEDKVDRQYGHFRNYPGKTLAEKLDTAGFDVVLFRRWGFPFYDAIRHVLSRSGKSQELVEGKYGIVKKILATAVYYLCFLNVLPWGWQVFAVGRSREFNPSASALQRES